MLRSGVVAAYLFQLVFTSAACATNGAQSTLGDASASSSSSSHDGGRSTLTDAQAAGLAAIIAAVPKDVPMDNETATLAAQIAPLEEDRAAALGAADIMQIEANDPANSAIAAQLRIYQQRELTTAASDLAQIQALLGKSRAKGAGFVRSTDGGAVLVLSSIVNASFAAQAQVVVAAAVPGKNGPTSNEVSSFLQQDEIVMADMGPGGHGVAARAVGRALANGQTIEQLTAPARNIAMSDAGNNAAGVTLGDGGTP